MKADLIAKTVGNVSMVCGFYIPDAKSTGAGDFCTRSVVTSVRITRVLPAFSAQNKRKFGGTSREKKFRQPVASGRSTSPPVAASPGDGANGNQLAVIEMPEQQRASAMEASEAETVTSRNDRLFPVHSVGASSRPARLKVTSRCRTKSAKAARQSARKPAPRLPPAPSTKIPNVPPALPIATAGQAEMHQ